MKRLLACALMLPALCTAQTVKGSCANPFVVPLPSGQRVSARFVPGRRTGRCFAAESPSNLQNGRSSLRIRKEAHAGDVTIQIDKPEDYRVAEASVIAGDLRARAFGVLRDGLFRSFRQNNPDGTYRLHAALMAGDLTLEKQRLSRRQP